MTGGLGLISKVMRDIIIIIVNRASAFDEIKLVEDHKTNDVMLYAVPLSS